jgi:hypothetical protein
MCRIPVGSAEQAPPASLHAEEREQVAHTLETMGVGIKNIKIESQMWVERRASLSEEWERTPISVAATAWFDGFPISKARVDVHSEVLEWHQGAAPYSTSSYTITFTGSAGAIIHRAAGYGGQLLPRRRATILAGLPDDLRDGGWVSNFTGVGASVYPLMPNTPRRLSQFVRHAEDAAKIGKGTEIKVYPRSSSDPSGSTLHIDLIAQGQVAESYRLDPSRGFALLEYKSVYTEKDGGEKVRFRTKVNILKEVSPGIWYPVEATFERPTLGPTASAQPFERLVYRASSITINDPNFADSVFTVPIPEGYLVDDKVSGTRYRVGQEQKGGMR